SPDNSDAYLARGFVNVLIHAMDSRGPTDKEIADRIRDYDKAIQLNPENAQAYLRRGSTHARRGGDAAQALAAYSNAIRLGPGDVEALLARGEFLENIGKLDLALADYSEAVRVDAGYRYGSPLQRRKTLFKSLKKYDQALADASRIISLHQGLSVS